MFSDLEVLGLWIRPLQALASTPDTLLLTSRRFGRNSNATPAYDPTIPEALSHVLDKVKDAVSWGYELIKHDYTTFELFGRWGFKWALNQRFQDQPVCVRAGDLRDRILAYPTVAPDIR